MKIAESGYYGGDPERVLSARVDMVTEVFSYMQFASDYECTQFEINKED